MKRPAFRPATGRRARAGAVLFLIATLGVGAACAEPLGLPLTVPLPGPLPPVRALTFLAGIHVLGVCFGLGGATMLDFWILRWLRRGDLPGEIARTFGFVSKVCTVGLGMLWLSGLGFLALYAVESPDKLANPKIWAKLTIVLALTLNGVVIASVVLPSLVRDLGRPLLDSISGGRATLFLASGAISGVSWYSAFALGLMREFNGTVAYGLLISLWSASVVATFLGAHLVWVRARRRFPSGGRCAGADDAAAAGHP